MTVVGQLYALLLLLTIRPCYTPLYEYGPPEVDQRQLVASMIPGIVANCVQGAQDCLCTALQQGRGAWALSLLPSLWPAASGGPAVLTHLCSCVVAACELDISSSGAVVATTTNGALRVQEVPQQLYASLMLAVIQASI